MRAMVQAGLISGANDPKFAAMSASAAAKALSESGLDLSKVSDPAVVRAVELAKRVASGSQDAARELAAQGEVQQQQQARARLEAEVQRQKKQLSKTRLRRAANLNRFFR